MTTEDYLPTLGTPMEMVSQSGFLNMTLASTVTGTQTSRDSGIVDMQSTTVQPLDDIATS